MSGQRHPDATALAEYQAGLTSGARGRRLAAHVASCARCASVGDQLTAVSSALATAPAPPMPDAVESRIAAALAAEADRTTEATPDTPAPRAAGAAPGGPRHDAPGGRSPSSGGSRSPGTSRHDPAGPGRRGRRSSRGARRFRPAMVLSGAAAAVLIGVAVVLGLTHLPSSSSSSSAASGSAASAPSRPEVAGGEAPANGAREPAASAPNASFVLTTSGTRYQPATLTTQVRAKMAAQSHASGEALSGRSVSRTLAACVLHLTGNVRPSLVDRATYQGKPAYVIAVPDRVWVVGLGCTASDPDLITSAPL
ncbi:MAG TPA: hypothetical protein VH589_23950 [Trebonia sp.]|jgi:hypothetical protein